MGKQSRRKNRPGGGSSAKNAGAEQVQHFPDHTKNLPDINFDYHHCSLCGKELELTSDWKEVVSTFMPCCGAAACNRCSHKWNKSKDQSLDANQTKFDMLVDAATKREIPDIPGLLAIINARADAQTCPDCKVSLHRHNKELVARMTRLAAGGHALGQYTLAIAHRRGKFGLIPNGQTALGWYQKAADSGISSAATAMGNMYQLGGGIPQNFSKAKALYLRALEISSQDAEAMFGLGYLYQNGSEVERDEEAALSWFRCSAQQEEYPDGIVKYAVALADRGLEKEALDWYLKAAKLDRRFPRNYRDTIAEAQYRVGTLLLDFHRDEGRPVAEIMPLARFWLNRAKENGDHTAPKMLRFLEQEFGTECGSKDCTRSNASLECSQCKSIDYCCRKCQTTHWRLHKKQCREIAQLKRELTSNVCASCRKDYPKFECAKCCEVQYCSVECQHAHWKDHKADCK